MVLSSLWAFHTRRRLLGSCDLFPSDRDSLLGHCQLQMQYSWFSTSAPCAPPPAHTFWCILIFRFMLKCVAFDHFVFTCVGRGQLLRKAARKSAEAYVPNSTQTTCLTWLLKGSETAEMSNWRPGMWLVLIVEESHPLIGRDSHLVKIVHPQQHSRSSEGPHCCL